MDKASKMFDGVYQNVCTPGSLGTIDNSSENRLQNVSQSAMEIGNTGSALNAERKQYLRTRSSRS